MSSIDPSYCCVIHSKDDFQRTVSVNQALLVATTIIGLAFIITGLYLLLGGIGTIPSQTGGAGLLLGGSGILFATGFCFFRKN